MAESWDGRANGSVPPVPGVPPPAVDVPRWWIPAFLFLLGWLILPLPFWRMVAAMAVVVVLMGSAHRQGGLAMWRLLERLRNSA